MKQHNRCISSWPLLSLLVLPIATAYIGPDGTCLINVFAPFTRNGETARGLLRDDMSVGFSNMVAAVLATYHFNSRNHTILPGLADLAECDVQLQIAQVFNTGLNSHMSSRNLLEHLLESNYSRDNRRPLCAIAGPSHDTPASDLAVLSFAADAPLVAAYSESIVRDEDAESSSTPEAAGLMRSSVFPDMLETTGVLVSFLQYIQRNNYIALLHPLSDQGLQRRSTLGILLDMNDIKWIASEYNCQCVTGNKDNIGTRSIRAAMQRIKDSGYRTIIIAMGHTDEQALLQSIANAAQELGMNNGQYFYVFYDTLDFAGSSLNDPNVHKLVRGSVSVAPFTPDILGFTRMPLRFGWSEQLPRNDLAATRDEINQLNPIAPDDPGYNHANVSFFDSTEPEYGAAFMYDAVMSIGFGACEAQRQLDGSVTGADHHQAIRQTQFFGASGDVQFGSSVLERGGTRPGRTLMWMALNYLAEGEQFVQTTDVLWGDDSSATSQKSDIGLPDGGSLARDQWQKWSNFTYADGTHVDPAPLRTPGNPNYFSDAVRIAGLTLMGITMMVCIGVAAWVYLCRKHRVLAASQPPFLYMICFGTTVQASSVFAISFDEGAGWTQDQLNALCMAFPWLFALGFMIVCCTLFTKLWKVHKVLQFTRQRIKITQIAWPMFFLMVAALLILSLWTALDPLEWERKEIDEATGDSVGTCRDVNGELAAFLPSLLVVLVLAGILMAYMAYRTKDVDEAYSESHWIFLLIVVQMEVIVVAAPILLRLHGEDGQDATYLVFVLLILSFPWATNAFIFIPKAIAYTKAVRGVAEKRKRGQLYGTPQVTGLEAPATNNVQATPVGTMEEERAPDHAENTSDIVVEEG